MITPYVLKMCEKDPGKKAELAKQLRGCWLDDNILAVTGRDENIHLSLPIQDVLKIMIGHTGLTPVFFRLGSTLSQFGADYANAGMSRIPNWYDSHTQCVVGPIKDRKIETIRVPETVRYGVVQSYADCILFPLATIPRIGIEFLLCFAVRFRKLFSLNLVQVLRVIHRNYTSGNLSLAHLTSSCKLLDDKFTTAAVQLAVRGFKSKRFIGRPLVVGEQVIWSYDSRRYNHSTQLAGTVVRMGTYTDGLVGKVVIVLNDTGREYSANYGGNSRFEVRPLRQ